MKVSVKNFVWFSVLISMLSVIFVVAGCAYVQLQSLKQSKYPVREQLSRVGIESEKGIAEELYGRIELNPRLLTTTRTAVNDVVAFFPAGKYEKYYVSASVSFTGYIHIIDSIDGGSVGTFSCGGLARPEALKISPDGTMLAVGIPGLLSASVKIFDTTDWKKIIEFKTAENDMHVRLAFSSDSKFLAVTSGKTIHIFDIQNKIEVRQIVTNTPIELVSIAFSPDGELIATGGRYDNLVEVWKTGDGSLLKSLRSTIESPSPVNVLKGGYFFTGIPSLSFTPDGKKLLGGIQFSRYGDHSRILVWNSDDWTLSNMLEYSANFDLAPDGKRIALVANHRALVISNIDNWKIEQRIPVYGLLCDMCWSPDCNIIVTATSEKVISPTDPHTFLKRWRLK